MTILDTLKEKHIKLNTEVKLLEQLRNTLRDADAKILLLKTKKRRLAVKDKIAELEREE